MEQISIIVPCYNEQEALPYFSKEIIRVADQLTEYKFQIIFVNDGSKDRTLELLKTYEKNDSRMHYISFSRNFGKEAAMYAGFRYATGDYVAVMDADMQDPPALLPDMIQIIKDGEYDSVATRRENRDGEPPIRSFFAKKFYKIINKISDADVVDGARDFRLMNRKMVDAICSMCEYNRFSKGIFGWVGFRTYWLPYKNVERVAGEKKWNFWKLFKYAMDGIINFSQVPLSIASCFGVVMTGISAIMFILLVVKKLLIGDPVDGWTSLICVVILIGGIQLFCLGIIGQYIAKIYMESKKRPHYIVAETDLKSFRQSELQCV